MASKRRNRTHRVGFRPFRRYDGELPGLSNALWRHVLAEQLPLLDFLLSFASRRVHDTIVALLLDD